MDNDFSGNITGSHEFLLPEEGIPAGYTALIDASKLPAPFLHTKMAIGLKHRIV